ncbi:hypothetical protein [Streptomyces sp. NPDC051561]|uniref:hypothetical protein n=1 Tax=Streptomyces sp. NPDC051561 TaxID=3365658 RepID=UPI0037B5A238
MTEERNDVLGWAAMLACIGITAHGEWSLAVSSGYNQIVAAGLPIAIDSYAIRAMKTGREVFWPVLLMVATNAAAHLVDGGALVVSPWLVVAVSAIAPLVLWRVHGLQRTADHVPGAAKITTEVPRGPLSESTVERVPAVVDTPPVPAHPAIEAAVPAVPEAAPAGVRLLPIVAAGVPSEESTEPVPVSAARESRPHEVHAEYMPQEGEVRVPENEPGPLTEYGAALAVQHFKDDLLTGEVPSIRAIKERLGVGQVRAKQVQEAIRVDLEAHRLEGVRS